ncbi:MAG: DUF4339 domain-containing protein [Verrucomicrobiae bacterium]|nr:DUF4339 domain-containing protein [Verrucomicrobiae bacterium]
MQITISRDGQIFGPYFLADCRNYLQSGQLVAEDFAWHEGLGDWEPLAAVVDRLNQEIQLTVMVNNRPLSPMNLPALKQAIGKGEVTGDALVWHEGMPDWEPVNQFLQKTGPVQVAGEVEKKVFTIESQDRKSTMRISIPDIKSAWLKSTGKIKASPVRQA